MSLRGFKANGSTTWQGDASMMESAMQDRRSERLATSVTGVYRTPRGFECAVDVDDLSLGGCRVDDTRGGLMLGEYVRIMIGAFGPYVAEVAWRQSTRVGLQFTKSLPMEVVEELTGFSAKDPEPKPKATGAPVPTPYQAPHNAPSSAHPSSPTGLAGDAAKAPLKPAGPRRFL